MNIPSSTEVLIIGAGPTGMALAISLAQAGVDHVIIDKLAAGQTTSRAAVVHAHTLEQLENLSVVEPMLSEGLKLSQFTMRDRDRVLAKLTFDGLPTMHPFLLMIPQDATERIFAELLAALGSIIHRPVIADAIHQDAAGVRVTVLKNGEPHMIRARYIVGADGMHSLVRRSAEIDFEGSSYEHSFVLADVEMDWAHGRDDVKLFFSPAGLVVVAPLPNGRYRIVATMEDAPEHPDASTVEAILAERGPTHGAVRVTGVHWASRFRLHHRLAQAYRRGRLLLVGDAAHAHSPAGGQGMNTGLVDAIVLGGLLTQVLRDGKPDSTLDLYEAMRRPAAAKVLRLADGLTHMATMKTTPERALRNARLTLMAHLPPARRGLAMNLSGLSRRAAAELPFH